MDIGELQRASPASIHFIDNERRVVAAINNLKLAVMEGDIAEVHDSKGLFDVVAAAMSFPDYFGSNWDAVDECLEDMSWLPSKGYVLVLHGGTAGWSQNGCAMGMLVTSWLEATKYWVAKKIPFHLVFVI